MGVPTPEPGKMSLPQRFFTDESVYQQDVAWLQRNMWFLVGHESRIPSVGDYFLYEFDRDSIIVIRDAEGQIRAHHNVCRHRGSRICLKTNGTVRALTCPYHAWSYGLDGSLLGAPFAPVSFDKSSHALISCHVRTHDGLILVSFAESQPDFDTHIGFLARELELQDVQHAKVVKRALFSANANWKLLVQNNLECYHCRPAHPTFSAAHRGNSLGRPKENSVETSYEKLSAAIRESESERKRRFTAVQARPDLSSFQILIRLLTAENCSTESVGGEPVAPLMGQCTFDGMQTVALLSPIHNIVMNPDYVVIYTFTPRSLRRTDVEVMWLVKDTAVEGVDFQISKVAAVWEPTLQEDKVLVENAQLGVESSAYRPGPYIESERAVGNFDLWYLRHVVSPSLA